MHQVKIEVFEGPLDLLLHLVRKDEIDIFDIPIHQITSEYLEYLLLIERYDLNASAEFLIMAAILIQIKARLLLPKPEPELGEEVEEDPRTELVRMLLEYREYKEAANLLKERSILQEKVYTRPPKEGIGLVEASLFDLLSAFQELMEKRPARVEEISLDEINVNQRMEELLALLEGVEGIGFGRLFYRYRTKDELIATLLALLELVRLRKLCVSQKAPFSEIWIYKG